MFLRIRLYSFRFCQLPQPVGGQVPVVAQGGEAGSAVAVAVGVGVLSELDEDAAGLAA